MTGVKKMIRSCDQFGVLSQITFFNNDVKFQTIYGGILSMIIYLLGFAYFIYIMVIWQTYQIPPFYMSQVQFNPDIKFTLTQPLFVFGVINPIGHLTANTTSHDYIQSLSEKGVYYTPQVIDELLDEMTPNIPGYQCVVTKNESYIFDPICLNLQDQKQTTVETNYNNPALTNSIYYTMVQCNVENINKTQKCLTDKEQLYLTTHALWKLTLFTQDVNIKTGEIISIEQDYYYYNNVNQSTFQFIFNIRKATFIIDKGILFPEYQVVEVVRSIDMIQQKGYLRAFEGGFHEFCVVQYTLDSQEEIIRVTYPKLGAILAQVFSIFQLLLLTGILMNMFNKRIMNFNIEQALLQVYFPQIKLFKFEFDWKGKIKSILFKDKILQNEEFKKVKQFRETRAMQLRGKLNSTNILFEMSRMQIHLQSKIPISEYMKLHALGYKMNLPQNLSEQILLDDQDQLIDYYDLNVINEKYKGHTEEILYVEDNPKIHQPPFRSITEMPTVTNKNKQVIQPHNVIKDMNRVQPEEIIFIDDHHQSNLPPNRSITQIPSVSQNIQIIQVSSMNKIKVQNQEEKEVDKVLN